MNAVCQTSAAYLRSLLRPGTVIEIVRMDDPCPIVPGTRGKVDHVDDIGTVFCDFENGRYLGVLPDRDEFRIVR